MDNSLIDAIVKLKTQFVHDYNGDSHLHEVIPLSSSEFMPINTKVLNGLHNFAKQNPIYFRSFELEILNTPCHVYEGDISNFWIDSIKHDASYAPFYPTWILSAYAVALAAKNFGFNEVVDIGSGDGRISYCAKLIGLKSYGLEIDENLVDLQNEISSKTDIQFNPILADATRFDYVSLNLDKPAFFISGLPEMGEMLANGVISKITSIPNLKNNSSFVFMGSHSMRKFSRDNSKWGWGSVIDNFKQKILETITLPTYWTMEQPIDTPYVFTSSR